MFEQVAFYLFAFLTIGSFLITVNTNHPLYALTSLASGMIFISAFFFLLDADFLGIVQIVVYTGAVLAIYAFGMMFFDSTSIIKERQRSKATVFILGTFVAVVTVALIIAPVAAQSLANNYPPNINIGNVENIGIILFTKYLVPFEVAAIMLLTAMVAGIVLANKKLDLAKDSK